MVRRTIAVSHCMIQVRANTDTGDKKFPGTCPAQIENLRPEKPDLLKSRQK